MKKVFSIFFIIIIFVSIWSEFPVDLKGLEYISDVFWSSRGTDGWHEGADIPTDCINDLVYSINSGKAYWVQVDDKYPSNCFVGVGEYFSIGINYGHVYRNQNSKPDTIEKSNGEDSFYVFKQTDEGMNIGTINHSYPHLHFEYCRFVSDTLNWWNNRPTISDPMQYLNKTYPLNLQTPRFFWITENDIGDVTKIGKYYSKGTLGNVIDSVMNQAAIIYGAIQLKVAPASFTGVWCDYESNSNTYDIATKINNNNITAKSIEYPNFYFPKLSMVYKYGYRINNSDIYWQLDGDEYKNYINMGTEGNFEGLYADLTDYLAPFSVYCFTNIEGDGSPACNLDYYWATNMRDDEEGFYVDIDKRPEKVSKTNQFAKYKDGLNNIYLYASSYSTSDTSSMGKTVVPCFIDNYAPFIDRIVIDQNFEDVYVANYEVTADGVADIVIEKENPVDIDIDYQILISFSERMDTSNNPVVKVSNGVEDCSEIIGFWIDELTYASNYLKTQLIGDEFIVKVSEAYDACRNPLDIDPKTIACRNEQGEWENYEMGEDNNFRFKTISNPPIIQSVNVKVGEDIYYMDGWEFIEDGYTLLKKINSPVSLGLGEIEINVLFSKEMDVSDPLSFSLNREIELLGGVGTFYGEWVDPKLYRAVYKGVAISQLKNLFDADENIIKLYIILTGITDILENELDCDPSTFAYMENGVWYNYEKDTYDTTHTFNARKNLLTLTFNPDFGCIYEDSVRRQTLTIEAVNELINEDKTLLLNCDIYDNESGKWEIFPDLSVFSGLRTLGENDIINKTPSTTTYNLSTYTVKNVDTDEYDRISIFAKVYGNMMYDLVDQETYFISKGESPEDNHPDDAQLVKETSYPTDRIYDPKSRIGILLNGASIGIAHIMGKYNTGVCGVIPDNFKISGISGRQLEDLDVLVIGSAGLYILNNPILQERLRKWVENGGTVISMTSQFGCEWNYLPIPEGDELVGFGWDEDQYCSQKSVYIEENHPIISGQTRNIPSMFVDGYLEKYPENAKTPLRRTISTKPALIEYAYGKGDVIITSDYVDWGYNHGQYFEDDLILVRDMIKYAEIHGKYVKEINDFISNQTNIEFYIQNNTSRKVGKCIVKVFSAINILQDEICFENLNILPEEMINRNISIDCTNRGIYTVKYSLYDLNENIILENEIFGGVVKYGQLEGDPFVKNGLKMWCTSDKDKCIVGDSVIVTTHLLNTNAEPFTGKIMVAIHEQNGVWFDIVDSLYFDSLLYNEQIEHNYKFAPKKNTSIETGLYLNNYYYYTSGFKNSLTGMVDRGIWIETNDVFEFYAKVIDDTISFPQKILIERKLVNKTSNEVETEIITRIDELNLTNNCCFTISSKDTLIDTLSVEVPFFPFDKNIGIISYLYVNDKLGKIIPNKVFIVPCLKITTDSEIDDSQINITNTVENVTDLLFKNIKRNTFIIEDDSCIQSNEINIDSIDERGMYLDSIAINYDQFKFGKYNIKIDYIISEDTLEIVNKFNNEIGCIVKGVKPSYTFNDTIKMNVLVINNGVFYPLPIMKMDLLAYHFEESIRKMKPGDSIYYEFAIPICDYFSNNTNNKISIELNGSTLSKNINVYMLPAKITSKIVCSDSIKTNDKISVKISNQGGSPATTQTTLCYIDVCGTRMEMDTVNSSINCSDSIELEFQIPSFLKSGEYKIEALTLYNDNSTLTSKTTEISGISIEASIQSLSKYYFQDQMKSCLANISSNDFIDTLFLNYCVVKPGNEATIDISGIEYLSNGVFLDTYLSPNYNGVGIAPDMILDTIFNKTNYGFIDDIAIDEYDNIYISDTYNDKIYVIDGEGNNLKSLNYYARNLLVDNSCIYFNDGEYVKCITKNGEQKWAIYNDNAELFAEKGDTVFASKYGCLSIIDKKNGKLLDIWIYDIGEILAGFYDTYYNSIILLTYGGEIVKINDKGEIFERSSMEIPIAIENCGTFYTKNDGSFGILFREDSDDENINILNYEINRYGKIIKSTEIDEYLSNWNIYVGDAVYKNGCLYFTDWNNIAVASIENDKIKWVENNLNMWETNTSAWLQTTSGKIYIAENGKILEYTEGKLTNISQYQNAAPQLSWSVNWGVEFGENIGIVDKNKVYLLDDVLGIYDSIISERDIDFICNTLDMTKLIICDSENNIIVYNLNKEIISNFNISSAQWIVGIDVDSYERLYIRDYNSGQIYVYDLFGNSLNEINAGYEHNSGEIFGGNNRFREYIVNNHKYYEDYTELMDIAGNKLIDIPALDQYDYTCLMDEEGGVIVRNLRWDIKSAYKLVRKNNGLWSYLLETEDNTVFNQLTVDKVVPEKTGLNVRYRIYDDTIECENVLWSNWYSESDISLNRITGKYLEIEACLQSYDLSKSPYLKGLKISVNNGNVIEEKDTILTDIIPFVENSIDYNDILPENIGKYEVIEKITNKYNQRMFSGKDKFDVIDSNASVVMNTLKENYKPDEVKVVNIQILNFTNDNNYELRLYKNDTLVLDTNLSVTDSVILTRTFSDTISFSLKAELFSNILMSEGELTVNVYAPSLFVEIQCDSVLYNEELDAKMIVENIGVHPVSINMFFGDELIADSLYPFEQKIISEKFHIFSDTILNGKISGDMTIDLQKKVKYMRTASMNLQHEETYNVASIDMPYNFVTNSIGNILCEISISRDSVGVDTFEEMYYLNPLQNRKLSESFMDSIALNLNSFWSIDIYKDTIYLTDWGNNEICVYDMNFNLIGKIADILGAAGIDVENDKIYVTEAEMGVFKIIDKNSFSCIKSISGLAYPGDIEVVGDDIYIIDWVNAAIMHYNTNGNYLGKIGTKFLQQPGGIEEFGGRIFVSDYGKNKIFIFDDNFMIIDSIVENLFTVEGITIDEFGLIYAGNWDDNSISVFSSSGDFVYRTNPMKSCWADGFKSYKNKYYTLTENGDIFVYNYQNGENNYYLNLDLVEGSYLITADIFDETHRKLFSHSEYNFNVFKNDTLEIASLIIKSDSVDSMGTFPVEFEISNIGAESFFGNYVIQLGDNYFVSDTIFIEKGLSKKITKNINHSFEIGPQEAVVSILKNGNMLATKKTQFNASTSLIIEYFENDVTITSGTYGKIPYRIRNKGIAYGKDFVKLEFGEFLVDSFSIFLDKNGIYEDSIYLEIPEDISSGQHNGYLETRHDRELLSFNVVGLEIGIIGFLDKESYRDGDNANFKLSYTNNNSLCPILNSYVRYSDYLGLETKIIGGYYEKSINIDSSRISGYGEYVSGLFSIDSLGTRDSILLNVYANYPINNGIDLYIRFSNNGLYFTNWENFVSSGLLHNSTGQLYLQYKLNLNYDAVIDSIKIGNKTLKSTNDFIMNVGNSNFEIPIDKAGNLLQFGVYNSFGRSIMISEQYVNKTNDTLTVNLDKYFYYAGESINVSTKTDYIGTFNWEVAGEMEKELKGCFEIDKKEYDFNIEIPLNIVTGFYKLNYEFEGIDTLNNDSFNVKGEIPFNLIGYELSVKKISIDKEQYYKGESVYAELDLITNKDMLINIVCYFKDEENNYSICYNENRWIKAGSSIEKIKTDLIPINYGNCDLIYKVFLLGLNQKIFMVSGQKSFRIADSSSPRFITFNLSACTLDINSEDSLRIDFTLSEQCRKMFLSIGNKTNEYSDIISGSTYWKFEKDINVYSLGTNYVTGSAFDYAYNETSPVRKQIYLIGNQEQRDSIPPISTLRIYEPCYLENALNFVSMNETDIAIESFDSSEVDTIYFKLNNSDWRVYENSFKVSDWGINTIEYYAVDILGNTEQCHDETLYSDSSVPFVNISIGEPFYGNYINSHTPITLKATDDLSGISFLKVFLPQDTLVFENDSVSFDIESYDSMISVTIQCSDNLNKIQTIHEDFYVDTTSPSDSIEIEGVVYKSLEKYLNAGSKIIVFAEDAESGIKVKYINCDSNGFKEVLEPISFATEGRHSIDYYTVDNVDNLSAVKTDSFICDFKPPVILYSVNGKYIERDSLLITAGLCSLNILSYDALENASGLKSLYLKTDEDSLNINDSLVVFEMIGSDILRQVSISAEDNVENESENVRIQWLTDNCNPITTLSVRGSRYNEFIGKESIVKINAFDDLAGIDSIYIAINQDRYVLSDSFSFEPTEEILYSIVHYATDKVGNMGQTYYDSLYADFSAPIISMSLEGMTKGDTIFIDKDDTLYIESYDAMSGVSGVFYKLNETIFDYTDALTFSEEDGLYNVDGFAVDNVNNVSDTVKLNIYIDTSSPVVNINIGEPKFFNQELFITSSTPIEIEAFDEGVGIEGIYYSLDNSALKKYIEPIYLEGEGNHKLEYFAIDLLDNRTITTEIKIVIDNSCPNIEESFAGEYLKFNNQYVIGDASLLTMSALDFPLLQGSGVKEMIVWGRDLNYYITDSLFTFSPPTSIENYVIFAVSADNLINYSDTLKINIEVDIIAPVVSIDYPTACSYLNVNTEVFITVNDKHLKEWTLCILSNDTVVDTIKCGITSMNNISAGIINTDELSNGEYEIFLQARDFLGNLSECRRNIFIMEPVIISKISGLSHPEGIFACDSGIFVANTKDDEILKYDYLFGSYLKSQTISVNNPNAVLFDVNAIYATCWENINKSSYYDIYLQDTLSVLTSKSGFNHPKGLARGSISGSYLTVIADRNKDRLVTLDSLLNVNAIINGIKHPEGVAFDSDGYLYTCVNYGKDRDEDGETYLLSDTTAYSYILKIDSTGNIVSQIGGIAGGDLNQFAYLSDIEIDSQNKIWVCDRDNDRIAVLSSSGRLMQCFGSDELNKPEGISIYDGKIFVADRNNNRIAVFGYSDCSEEVTLSALSSKITSSGVSVEISSLSYSTNLVLQISGYGECAVKIYDVCGRDVLNKTISVSSEKKTYVALSGLKSGTYFASIETIDGSNTGNRIRKKIIVLK